MALEACTTSGFPNAWKVPKQSLFLGPLLGSLVVNLVGREGKLPQIVASNEVAIPPAQERSALFVERIHGEMDLASHS